MRNAQKHTLYATRTHRFAGLSVLGQMNLSANRLNALASFVICVRNIWLQLYAANVLGTEPAAIRSDGMLIFH